MLETYERGERGSKFLQTDAFQAAYPLRENPTDGKRWAHVPFNTLRCSTTFNIHVVYKRPVWASAQIYALTWLKIVARAKKAKEPIAQV